MAEQQKKGTQKTTGSETEKTVHDLTKQEDLTRVLDQSLRALQEMEQRLQALEQELGSIGVRPGQPSSQKNQAQSAGGGSQQYIGAPNPHGLHNPAAMLGMTPGATGATSPYAAGYYPPYGPSSPYAQRDAAYGAYPSAYAAPPAGAFGAQAPALGYDPRLARLAASGAQAGVDPISGASSGSPVSEAMQVGQPEVPESTGEFGGAHAQGGLTEGSPQVRQAMMDVVDRNEEFLIHWELPGVKKENLDIMVTDRSLILNAKAFPENEDGIVVHTERPPSVYRRTVPFQTEVDTSKAKAELKDGVLTVHVPKRTPSKGPKRLDVAYG